MSDCFWQHWFKLSNERRSYDNGYHDHYHHNADHYYNVQDCHCDHELSQHDGTTATTTKTTIAATTKHSLNRKEYDNHQGQKDQDGDKDQEWTTKSTTTTSQIPHEGHQDHDD